MIYLGVKMAKKKRYEQDYCASAEGQDYFCKFYVGMTKHDAFIKLETCAKMMYVYCRVQAISSDGKRALYKHAENEGKRYSPNAFVFPSSHFEKYGLERSNAAKQLKKLEESGFIKVIERNAHRHKPNVYEFSAEWRNDKKNEDTS